MYLLLMNIHDRNELKHNYLAIHLLPGGRRYHDNVIASDKQFSQYSAQFHCPSLSPSTAGSSCLVSLSSPAGLGLQPSISHSPEWTILLLHISQHLCTHTHTAHVTGTIHGLVATAVDDLIIPTKLRCLSKASSFPWHSPLTPAQCLTHTLTLTPSLRHRCTTDNGPLCIAANTHATH